MIGGVSDGEFNSLRTQGATRPLHIWQLIHDAKESVSRQSERTLMAMLQKTGGEQKCMFFMYSCRLPWYSDCNTFTGYPAHKYARKALFT